MKLHAVDYRAVGLADFGRPEGYLERQVRRWSQQWERSKTSELPAIEELIRRFNEDNNEEEAEAPAAAVVDDPCTFESAKSKSARSS